MIRKIVSILIAFLVYFYITNYGAFTLRTLLFLPIGILCIWFSNEIGRMSANTGKWRAISESPAIFIEFVGWIFLFLPILLSFIFK